MDEVLKVVQFLKKQRAQIVWNGDDDEGAAEYYGHITDIIEDLEAGKMTLKEASASLGMNLAGC